MNRDKIQTETYEELLQDPKNIEMAVNILSDLSATENTFGDFQAQARVGSIGLLRHAAKKGDVKPVKEVITRLGNHLNQTQEWKRGVQHDYVDVIAIYLDTITVEELVADAYYHFEMMGLSERTSVEIQRGIYDSDFRSASPEQLESLVAYFKY